MPKTCTAEAADGAGGRIPVTVCIAAGPGRIEEIRLEVPAGARVSDVLELQAVRDLLLDAATVLERDVGIWGRRCPLAQVLAAGDRLEVYRPLRVDPMTARRERFRKQGVRATGLFAKPSRNGSGD